MKLLHIGFSNVVSMNKVVAIISPDSVAAKRIREKSKEEHTLIDCTMGRKLRSMVLTDSQYTFLSAMRPEALLQRLENSVKVESTEEESEA